MNEPTPENPAPTAVPIPEESPERLVPGFKPIADKTLADIVRRFTYHPPKNDQAARYDVITSECRDLAILICQLCPDSRERSTALTYLTQVRMLSNAAIACNE